MNSHLQASTFTLENVAFERNQTLLFKQLNCHLPNGSLLQIQGANGAGKSTLLRICAGYIEPQVGKVLWQDQTIFKNRDVFQQKVHYLGHHNSLKPQLTVMENLQLACALAGQRLPSLKVQNILAQLQSDHIAHSQTRFLSAGQCRRVSLARLLLVRRHLWLLDEPGTALDKAGQNLLTNMLTEHINQGGIALVVTHQPLPTTLPLRTLTLGENNVCNR